MQKLWEEQLYPLDNYTEKFTNFPAERDPCTSVIASANSTECNGKWWFLDFSGNCTAGVFVSLPVPVV